MSSMIEWWQHIPEHINPIAFTVGFFSAHWYALCLLLGFLGAAGFFLWSTRAVQEQKKWDAYDLLLALAFGALLGGRIGFVLLYRPDVFLDDPLRIVSPYDFASGQWTGISGMSFHGGLIGATLALFLCARRRRTSFFQVADVIALAVPIALFFGRIGNFLNQELYGRLTERAWGMYFPVAPAGALRHPSALYEALGEGVVLFCLLWWAKRRIRFSGGVSALFILGYGIIRFALEYFREPDAGAPIFWGTLTLGQVYSIPLVVIGAALFLWLREKSRGTLVA